MKDELIAKQKEYIEYLRSHLWNSNAVYKYESEISALEADIEQEPVIESVKTAEEILRKSSILYELEKPNNYNLNYVRTLILQAMEKYTSQFRTESQVKTIDLREELVQFCNTFNMNTRAVSERLVDEYLNSKQ